MIPDKYKCDYKDSVYYPIWFKALDYIKGRVLELGCGTGQFAKMLDKLKHPTFYTGVDINKEWIGFAKKTNPNLKFYVRDIHNIDWTGIKAETICVFEVLEHLEDDLKLIEKIPKSKKIIFSVPDFMTEGHYRCFKDEKEIKERFSMIDITKIEEFKLIKNKLGGTNSIFLCVGRKK